MLDIFANLCMYIKFYILLSQVMDRLRVQFALDEIKYFIFLFGYKAKRGVEICLRYSATSEERKCLNGGMS